MLKITQVLNQFLSWQAKLLLVLDLVDVGTDMWWGIELITSNTIFTMLGVLGWISIFITIAAVIGFVVKIFFLRYVCKSNSTFDLNNDLRTVSGYHFGFLCFVFFWISSLILRYFVAFCVDCLLLLLLLIMIMLYYNYWWICIRWTRKQIGNLHELNLEYKNMIEPFLHGEHADDEIKKVLQESRCLKQNIENRLLNVSICNL